MPDLINKARLITFRLTLKEEVDLFATAYYFHDARLDNGRLIDPDKVQEQREQSKTVLNEIIQSLKNRDEKE